MDITLTAYGDDEEVNISVPISAIIKEHWKGNTPPDVLTVSTGLGDEVAQASFVLDKESSSHQSIALSTENKKTCRQCSWFRLELAENPSKDTRCYLYGGDHVTEDYGPLATIRDGTRDGYDRSRRVLWANKSLADIEPWTESSRDRFKAVSEDQLTALVNAENAPKFDYEAYGKNLAANPNNTIEFISGEIVSKDEKEINLVADTLDAMGFTAVTGYYDPAEDERSGVTDELTGYHYVEI